MGEPIHRVLEALPQTSLTTRLLGALDYLVPGEWENVTVFEEMVRKVTGESDPALVQKVGERAIAIYNDGGESYQRAVEVFHLVDDVGTLAGVASFANRLGEDVKFLGFLDNITPKPEKTQAIDAGVKFAAELVNFCFINGIPGDSVGDFAGALASYEKEDRMRIAAWLAFDCVLPFGPDFIAKIMDHFRSTAAEELGQTSRFAQVAHLIPGNAIEEKVDLITKNLDAASGHLNEFVAGKGMTQSSVLDTIRQHIDIAEKGGEYIAAAIDIGTNCFEHTGIQTVARKVITRAYGEI